MVVGSVGILGTASKTSAFGLDSFHKDQARITMVLGSVGVLGTAFFSFILYNFLFFFYFLIVVAFGYLCGRRLVATNLRPPATGRDQL